MSIDVTVILPAYNEAARIGDTIGEIVSYFEARALQYEIIVAADGNDGTRERVRELGRANSAIRAIGHEARSGKGRGVREAVALAGGGVIGYVDADNKVPIEDYEQARPWFTQGYDVVIGSRNLERSAIERRQPLYRQIGGKGFGIFMQALVGLPGITDTQCGFKFFRGEVARELFRVQQIDGYMFDVEILALAQRLGYRIQQIPVRWRDDHDSRLDLMAGNARNVIDLFRIAWRKRVWRERVWRKTRAGVR